MLPRGIRRRFRLFRGHGDVEDDLDAEIAFHLDTRTEALVAAGMSPEPAREEALRQFGNVRRARREMAATDHRDTGRRLRTDWIEAAWSDLRVAARGLGRAPAFTAMVVVTLALGLGATAAMFGVLDRLLLQPPIGVRDPDQVARLYVQHPKKVFFGSRYQWSFSYADLGNFAIARSLEGMAFDGGSSVRLDDELGTARVHADLVSGAYFTVLGVHAVRGRMLLPADDSASSPPAALVSYDLWTGRYGRDSSIIGSLVRVNGRAYTVVGVTPRGFSGLSPGLVDLWLPATIAGNDVFGFPGFPAGAWQRQCCMFDAVARLPHGYRPAQVAAELTLVLRRAQSLQPPDPFLGRDSGATVALGSIIPGRFTMALGRASDSLSLSLLVAAVALIVCLIAVANVANLLLLRALSRRRETGIRLALGVSRWRLLRSVLAESLLLALVAAAAGAWISSAGGELLRRLLLQDTWAAPLFDMRVFAFVALTAFAVGVLTGLVPAFFGGRTDVLASLRAGVRLSAWRRSRLRGGLMVGQVALTLVLLAGFGLFARSLDKAEHVDFGADVNHLVMLSPQRTERGVTPAQSKMTSAALDALLDRVRRLPGVRAAALAAQGIPMWSFGVRLLRAEGVASVPNSTDQGGPFFSQIGPGYLQTVGLPLKRGRMFAPSEYASPATVALVSEEMARRLWPGQDAIGKCLYVRLDMTAKTQPPCSVIVGIVGNERRWVYEPPLMQYFLPLPRDAAALEPDIVVRAARDPEPLVAPLTALAKVENPNLSSFAVRALPTLLGEQVQSWRLASALLAMFGALALLVAMVGMYSVVAFDAAQRRNEFGIRVALGARGWDLARLMLGQGLRYGVSGGLLGFALVVVAGRFIASQLFHTSPHDPIALGATALLLLAAVLTACALPARAAVRADPRVSLQAD